MPPTTPTPPVPPRPKERELAQWNERFDRADYWFGTEPTPFLKDQAHRLKPGMTALAIADGEGRNGVWLARQGLKVTSVDLSPKGIAKSRQLAKRFGAPISRAGIGARRASISLSGFCFSSSAQRGATASSAR
jgi:SAM-dependent methyltransferase